MKYKLPRQVITKDLEKIISREMRKQKIPVSRPSKNNLKEIDQVSRIISKSGLPKHLICKKLDDKLGHGIFLHPDAKPILKGQIIACYSGELSLDAQNGDKDGSYSFTPIENIRLNKEEHHLFDKKRSFHPRRLYCLWVDAIKSGNFTRFINHSDKPNVDANFYKIPRNSFGLAPSMIEVVYLANKTIKPGEQLLVSYEGDEYGYWACFKIKPFPMTPKTFRLSSSLKLIRPS